jgi:hypothetical protein
MLNGVHTYQLTRFFFAGHTGHEFAEKCPLIRDFSITRRVLLFSFMCNGFVICVP